MIGQRIDDKNKATTEGATTHVVRKTESLMEYYDNDWAVKLRLHEGLDGMNE